MDSSLDNMLIWASILKAFSTCFGLALWWHKFKTSLADRIEAIFVWRVFAPRCEYCEKWLTKLSLESSRTLYHFEGAWYNPENPNRPVLLCPRCAEAHHEHWDEMWGDYNRGRL